MTVCCYNCSTFIINYSILLVAVVNFLLHLIYKSNFITAATVGTVLRFLKKNKNKLPYDPAILKSLDKYSWAYTQMII